MKQTILTIAVTALCIVACTSEDHISQDPLADTPIKLNVSVTNPTTRAGYSNDLKPDTFWLKVYHDDYHNDKYNYDIFAEKGRIRQTLWRRCADANLKLLPNDT